MQFRLFFPDSAATSHLKGLLSSLGEKSTAGALSLQKDLPDVCGVSDPFRVMYDISTFRWLKASCPNLHAPNQSHKNHNPNQYP